MLYCIVLCCAVVWCVVLCLRIGWSSAVRPWSRRKLFLGEKISNGDINSSILTKETKYLEQRGHRVGVSAEWALFLLRLVLYGIVLYWVQKNIHTSKFLV